MFQYTASRDGTQFFFVFYHDRHTMTCGCRLRDKSSNPADSIAAAAAVAVIHPSEKLELFALSGAWPAVIRFITAALVCSSTQEHLQTFV